MRDIIFRSLCQEEISMNSDGTLSGLGLYIKRSKIKTNILRNAHFIVSLTIEELIRGGN